jgi:cellulose synthase/poly-beta-1,6-N-acetylglucosamine synthase-like glycosyltransferase
LKSTGRLYTWLSSYYPIRYYIAAFVFSYVFLGNFASVQNLENQILLRMLHFVDISSYHANGNLYVGTARPPPIINPPVYWQLLFLVFFPTVAVTARINFRMRIRILIFGILCFFVFIISQFLVILFAYELGITQSLQHFVAQALLFITSMSAGSIIALTLFSTLTLPNRTKIKPIIKRNYIKEYIFLISTFTGSFIIVYALNLILKIEANSPITAYLTLQVNISTTILLSYFFSYFIYAAKTPTWLKISNSSTMHFDSNTNNNSLASFLIPAYNEQKTIKKCIESIDKAASRYGGKTEIIVVNDGSTDRTGEIIEDVIKHLKYSDGKVFHIPNSGKGFALAYGLEKTSGDIVFRMDADSIIDEFGINPIMNHFLDPHVGIVGGMILPLEEKTILQKTVGLLFINFMYIFKRAQELVDSILVQAGAFSVFRKEALLQVGGWNYDQFGEDGELTNRMARFGYKCELELRATVYSEVPAGIVDLTYQRSRWAVAYYHSRQRNLEVIKELKKPRSIIFLFNILTFGMSFAHSLIWPFLLASVITGFEGSSLNHLPLYVGIPYKLAVIQSITFGIQIIMFVYFLRKANRVSNIIYFPLSRFLSILFSIYIRPQVMEVLLAWSSKWKEYSVEAFEDLRKEVKKSVDPEKEVKKSVDQVVP